MNPVIFSTSVRLPNGQWANLTFDEGRWLNGISQAVVDLLSQTDDIEITPIGDFIVQFSRDFGKINYVDDAWVTPYPSDELNIIVGKCWLKKRGGMLDFSHPGGYILKALHFGRRCRLRFDKAHKMRRLGQQNVSKSVNSKIAMDLIVSVTPEPQLTEEVDDSATSLVLQQELSAVDVTSQLTNLSLHMLLEQLPLATLDAQSEATSGQDAVQQIVDAWDHDLFLQSGLDMISDNFFEFDLSLITTGDMLYEDMWDQMLMIDAGFDLIAEAILEDVNFHSSVDLFNELILDSWDHELFIQSELNLISDIVFEVPTAHESSSVVVPTFHSACDLVEWHPSCDIHSDILFELDSSSATAGPQGSCSVITVDAELCMAQNIFDMIWHSVKLHIQRRRQLFDLNIYVDCSVRNTPDAPIFTSVLLRHFKIRGRIFSNQGRLMRSESPSLRRIILIYVEASKTSSRRSFYYFLYFRS